MRIWNRIGLVSLVLALIVTGGGYVIWKLYPAKFKAQARLQVSAQDPKVPFQTVETEAGDSYKRYQNTQLTLVKSQLVLNAALQDQGVSKYRMIRKQVDPIAWLQANLEVKFLADSEVMEIALSGDYPDEVAGVVNAVKKGYMEEVVNVDSKRRLERHDTLKKLREQYTNILKERRENLRKLTELVPSEIDPAVMEREKAELLLSHTLWSERLKVRLEQAEAETLLARRKEAVGLANDAVRKEIAQIEDRLAVLLARQKVLDHELERVSHGSSSRPDITSRKLDLSEMNREIAVMEESYRKVAAAVEALNVELAAPPRIRTIEDAIPPRTRG